MESTHQIDVSQTMATQVDLGRVDSGRTEESRQFPHRIAFFCLAGDAFVTAACLLVAFWLRFCTPIRELGIDAPSLTLADYAGYIVFGFLTQWVVFAHRQMYDARWVLYGGFNSLEIITACLIWGAVFLGFSLLLKFQPPLSRVYVTLATALVMVDLYAWRRFVHGFLRQDAIVCKFRQRILIVGWTSHAQRLANAIQNDPTHPYEVACCVRPLVGRYQQEPPGDLPEFGSYRDILGLLNTRAIDIVLVAELDSPANAWAELASLCEKEHVQFKVMPSYFNVLISGLHVEKISGVPLLGVSRLPLDRLFNRIVKRLEDVIGAAIGLILSVPLIAIFGTLVYLESPGPILYRQRRVGRNGKVFDIIKIRSMRLDAEENGKAGWSTPADKRRLRIGTFIRRWNIDEMPQFWNVLVGDMSLVGPRPERPEFICNFKHEIAHYNARHSVKPGITGWAQVNGLRGDTDLTERIRYDLYYMEHWSVLFDFQMMVMTFTRQKNAW